MKIWYLKEWNVSTDIIFFVFSKIVLLIECNFYLARSSSWSRVDKPVMEISDLSKEESMKYLVEKRKINKKEAKKLYELVGRRIVELKSVANKFLAEQTFEGRIIYICVE